MATGDRQRQTLQTIFSFFLGLMVLAFIGIAVNTIYPDPQQEAQVKLDKLYREMEPYNTKAPSDLSTSDRAKRDALQKQIDELQTKQMATMKVWARNTSIVLIILATAVMSISLVRSEQLRVLSNGLLLGGVFTMLYGVGWIIASGESWARLVVIFFATSITIALGYVKFVRMKQGAPVAGGAEGAGATVGTQVPAELEARLAAIEAKLGAAGDALSGSPHPPSD
jgi:hypothetical protein